MHLTWHRPPLAAARRGSSGAEHVLGKDGVGGSIPLHGTIFPFDFQRLLVSHLLCVTVNGCGTPCERPATLGEVLGEGVFRLFAGFR